MSELLVPSVTAVHRAIASQSTWLNTGRSINAEDLKGRIIILDFWNCSNINSYHIIPQLRKLKEEYKDKITVIGVHCPKFQSENNQEIICDAISKLDINYPIVDDQEFLVWKNFVVRTWPTTILISPLGKIEKVYTNNNFYEQIKSEIDIIERKHKKILVEKPLNTEFDEEIARVAEIKLRGLNYPGKILAVNKLLDGEAGLIIADSGNNRILLTDLEGKVKKVIGSGKSGYKNGSFQEAEFKYPQGILYQMGIIYVADTKNHVIRKISLHNESVETIAGTGEVGYNNRVNGEVALETNLCLPWDMEFYPQEQNLVIAMAGLHQLWQYNLANGQIKVMAGEGTASLEDGRYPLNQLAQPSGLAKANKELFLIDTDSSALRAYNNDNIETYVGTGLFDFGMSDGTRSTALMQYPTGICAGEDNNLYITDSYNNIIRTFNITNKHLSKLIGKGPSGDDDGAFDQATFNSPSAISKLGNDLYIADTNNHSIRKANLDTKEVTTLKISF